MKIIKWILLLAITAIFIAFAIYNRDTTTLRIPFSPISVETPIFILFFVSIILGIMVGGALSFFYKIKMMKSSYDNNKRVAALENEIKALKIEKRIHDSVPAAEE